MNIGVSENRAICKFHQRGICRFGNRCWNWHETPEKLTDKFITKIEPKDEDGACALPPKTHNQPLTEIYGPSTSTAEAAINLVKIAESEDKVCGICFDNILTKVIRSEQIFGILPNCNHCFCFTCLRKWRQSKEFELNVSKACPECRITSDYVYPSRVWIETKEEKKDFIDVQRNKMKQQDCKYFRKGKGRCPFGNTCLYLHALPNGEVYDVGPPKARREPASMNETETDLLEQILFWINFDDRDEFDVESDDDFELNVDDPRFALQDIYKDANNLQSYLAINNFFNESCSDDDEYEMFL